MTTTDNRNAFSQLESNFPSDRTRSSYTTLWNACSAPDRRLFRRRESKAPATMYRAQPHLAWVSCRAIWQAWST